MKFQQYRYTIIDNSIAADNNGQALKRVSTKTYMYKSGVWKQALRVYSSMNI